VIELRNVEEKIDLELSYQTLYAWVQHVDFDKRQAGDHTWIDGAVADALWRDTPAFSGINRTPLLHRLEDTARVITVVKIYENPTDYKNGFLPISSGVSICDFRDQWCRKVGRDKALRRALGKIGYLLDTPKGVVKTFRTQ